MSNNISNDFFNPFDTTSEQINENQVSTTDTSEQGFVVSEGFTRAADSSSTISATKNLDKIQIVGKDGIQVSLSSVSNTTAKFTISAPTFSLGQTQLASGLTVNTGATGRLAYYQDPSNISASSQNLTYDSGSGALNYTIGNISELVNILNSDSNKGIRFNFSSGNPSKVYGDSGTLVMQSQGSILTLNSSASSGISFEQSYITTQYGIVIESPSLWHTTNNRNVALKIAAPNNSVPIHVGTNDFIIDKTTSANVGIGTATPSYKLHVVGDVSGSDAHFDNTFVNHLTSSDDVTIGGDGNFARIRLRRSDNAVVGEIFQQAGTTDIINNQGSGIRLMYQTTPLMHAKTTGVSLGYSQTNLHQVTGSMHISGATTGHLTASGHVSASIFYGDGSSLTGINFDPAGNNTEIQFNDSGTFGASSDFTWNNTSKILNLSNNSYLRVGSTNTSTAYAIHQGQGAKLNYFTGRVIAQNFIETNYINSFGNAFSWLMGGTGTVKLRSQTGDTYLEAQSGKIALSSSLGTEVTGSVAISGSSHSIKGDLTLIDPAIAGRSRLYFQSGGSVTPYIGTVASQIEMNAGSYGITLKNNTTNTMRILSNRVGIAISGAEPQKALEVGGEVRFGASTANIHQITGSVDVSGNLASSGTVSASIFYGDGSNLTGIGGISSLVEDTAPQLGGNLDVNSFVITGSNIVARTSTEVFSASATQIDIGITDAAGTTDVYIGRSTSANPVIKIDASNDQTEINSGTNLIRVNNSGILNYPTGPGDWIQEYLQGSSTYWRVTDGTNDYLRVNKSAAQGAGNCDSIIMSGSLVAITGSLIVGTTSPGGNFATNHKILTDGAIFAQGGINLYNNIAAGHNPFVGLKSDGSNIEFWSSGYVFEVGGYGGSTDPVIHLNGFKNISSTSNDSYLIKINPNLSHTSGYSGDTYGIWVGSTGINNSTGKTYSAYFNMGEVIMADGAQVTGSLNVSTNITASGTVSASIFYGDGSNLTGIGGISSLVADPSPQLGGTLDVNGQAISGSVISAISDTFELTGSKFLFDSTHTNDIGLVYTPSTLTMRHGASSIQVRSSNIVSIGGGHLQSPSGVWVNGSGAPHYTINGKVWSLRADNTNGYYMHLGTSGDPKFTVTGSSVGINTDTPTANLDVVGTFNASGSSFRTDNTTVVLSASSAVVDAIALKGNTDIYEDTRIRKDLTVGFVGNGNAIINLARNSTGQTVGKIEQSDSITYFDNIQGSGIKFRVTGTSLFEMMHIKNTGVDIGRTGTDISTVNGALHLDASATSKLGNSTDIVNGSRFLLNRGNATFDVGNGHRVKNAGQYLQNDLRSDTGDSTFYVESRGYTNDVFKITTYHQAATPPLIEMSASATQITGDLEVTGALDVSDNITNISNGSTFSIKNAGGSFRFKDSGTSDLLIIEDSGINIKGTSNGKLTINNSTTGAYRLDVREETSVSESEKYVARFYNDGNTSDAFGIIIQCGADGTQNKAVTYLSARDGDGTSVGGLYLGTNGVFSLGSSSDERLKDNIRKTEVKALNLINETGIYDYEWKKTGATRKCGFIAQDLEKQYPEAVSEYEDDSGTKTKMISESMLIPVLTKAIQEQQEMIEQLLNRVEELENK